MMTHCLHFPLPPQEKRIKKRTFLRRPDTGSVEKGIMDAMVMDELGDRSRRDNSSRLSDILGSKGGRGKSSYSALAALKLEQRRQQAGRLTTPLTLTGPSGASASDGPRGADQGAAFREVLIT